MKLPIHGRVLPALALSLLSIEAIAQTPPRPDAGQILREVQPPALRVPEAVPPPRTEEPQPDAGAIDARIMVKSFRISGNTAISTETLLPLIVDLAGTERSLRELHGAAARLTAYYRQQGYAVARAYLPAQEIKDGVVAINIIEGRIDKRRLSNESRLSDDRANAYLGEVKDGDVIRSAQLDRGLLLLNDTPGVGSARATLQPGASVGTSELLVELNPAAPYAASLSLDNHGNRYTGEYRVGGDLYLNSPLRIGDQLAISALASDRDQTYGRVAYRLPIGSNGWQLGAAYFDTRYELARDFEDLDAHGKATSASVFVTYPFIRSQASNLYGALTWEEKRLTDEVDATSTETKKALHIANLSVYGDHQDGFGGGGINNFNLSLVFGQLDIKSREARAIDDASAETDGSYTRLFFSAGRLQRLSRTDVLSVSLSGQLASKNLDSAEKFSLGGAYGVRAYPQGEGIGDEGYLVTLEWRHDFNDVLQGTLFYDTGSVTINRNEFGTAPNSRTLSGVGVGMNASYGDTQLRASLAWPTQGGDPTSIPSSAERTPTLWVEMRAVF
jgi:hemolysin activation/secretion protein